MDVSKQRVRMFSICYGCNEVIENYLYKVTETIPPSKFDNNVTIKIKDYCYNCFITKYPQSEKAIDKQMDMFND